MNQTTIFDMMYPKYKIKKPIRLIEFFGGYGSQALALKYLGIEFEPPIKHRGRNVLCSKECWIKHQKKVSPFQNIPIASYKNGLLVKKYNSIKEASVDVNGLSTNIVKCLKGKIKSAYGYQWKYSGKCFNGNI